jgi:hypothetical protein
MDYRALLAKYIQHVIDYEGISFIERLGYHQSAVSFTEEELAELRALRDKFDSNG